MALDTFRSVVLPLLQKDPLPAINWLKHHRLLRSKANCGSCDSAMSWTKHAKLKDGYTRKCQTKGCVKYKYTTTISKDWIVFCQLKPVTSDLDPCFVSME